MPDEPLRLLILGAHPDDAEFHAGGLAVMYRELGHVVKMVSVTNGESGHHEIPPPQLAEIRRAEAAASAGLIGAASEVWDFPDGQLEPTLELRRRLIREIRAFRPDLLVTHRPNDYHPDHRAVGRAVQDSSYMVTVPHVVPEVPILPRDPVVAYMVDLFTKPYPLVGDVVIDIDGRLDTLVAMLACHASQVFEWLPFNQGVLDQVPAEQAERPGWVRRLFGQYARPRAERYRQELTAAYGPERAARVEFAEVFEISEYASPLDDSARRRLFPFLR